MGTVLGDTGGAMAKSRKSSVGTRRDASAIASRSRLLAFKAPPRSGLKLSPIEDRRQFYPGVRPARTLRQVARITMKSPAKKASSKRNRVPSLMRGPEVHAFKIPETTIVCVRRSIRKEIMHALKKAGKGVRKPKRNAMSSISCKRRK